MITDVELTDMHVEIEIPDMGRVTEIMRHLRGMFCDQAIFGDFRDQRVRDVLAGTVETDDLERLKWTIRGAGYEMQLEDVVGVQAPTALCLQWREQLTWDEGDDAFWMGLGPFCSDGGLITYSNDDGYFGLRFDGQRAVEIVGSLTWQDVPAAR